MPIKGEKKVASSKYYSFCIAPYYWIETVNLNAKITVKDDLVWERERASYSKIVKLFIFLFDLFRDTSYRYINMKFSIISI